MARLLSRILVSGGAGFIGSNFIRYLLGLPEFSGCVVNYDALTYAGNLENLADIDSIHGKTGSRRYTFIQGDICNRAYLESVFKEYDIDTVVHFAAESHVDRSILSPGSFIRTNVLGTYTLLDVARESWKGRDDVLFHHISTDEVFGSLDDSGHFTEATPYAPRSPYSASKASSDHLVRSYHHTYGMPTTLTNCSNNYGPYQFPEKLIPFMILNMLEGKPLPVYGDGKNIRDWLYVVDHNAAIWLVMNNGRKGESYNIGGDEELENIRILERLIELIAVKLDRDPATLHALITYVKDRPGHDRRYAIDSSKLKRELGWKPAISLVQGLTITVQWYLDNLEWCNHIRSGEYRTWLTRNYQNR
jgi:dTDP-glucose 4,6-dehydratase